MRVLLNDGKEKKKEKRSSKSLASEGRRKQEGKMLVVSRRWAVTRRGNCKRR